MANARRPTIKDVAAKAGVSFKTVSRVINGDGSVNAKMRKAVERSMASLGYRPHRAARALRGNRTFAIALLAGSRHEPTADEHAQFPEFLGDVLTGCTQACRPLGYHTVLEVIAYADRRQAEALAGALLDDLTPDGVVLLPPVCDLDWLLDLLEQRGIAFVRLMPGSQPDRGVCLSVDDFSAAREMTERLLAQGHRELAFISGPPDHLAADARREGFEAAIAACPGAHGTVGDGDFYMASGEREAARLLDAHKRPTAIFAANDSMAAGALRAATAAGLAVPEDLAIAGFDDSIIARLTTPGLTSIAQPTRELTQRAVEMLVRTAREGSPSGPQHLRLGCTIIERESTARKGG